MKIKLLATDVDGTITDADKIIDVKAIEALKKAVNAGLIVVLASGIPVQGLRPLAEFLGVSKYLIGENGAVIFDGEDRILLSNPEKLDACYRELKETYPEVDYYSHADTRLGQLALKNNISEDKVKPIAEKYGLKTVSSKFSIHVLAPNTSKAEGLKELIKGLDIKLEECAAVGDSMNDYEMIKEVGLGISVENGTDLLKEVADHVTKKPYGAGLMEAVDLILQKE